MDDRNFDDLIKRKVWEYEEPELDTAALAAFHHRMEAINPVPWYVRYKTELFVASAVLFTILVILWRLQFASERDHAEFSKALSLVKEQQSQIDFLQKQLNSVMAVQTDTVYSMDDHYNDRTYMMKLINHISSLEEEIRNLQDDIAGTKVSAPGKSYPGSLSQMLSPFSDDSPPLPDLTVSTIANHQKKLPPFSAVLARDIERHYFKGLGIRVGPVVEVSKSFYREGNGAADLTVGLLGDFLLSPSWSIETGGKFVHRFREISGTSLSSIHERLPHVNESLQPVVSADIDSWFVEFPVNLRFRYPLSLKSQWIAGGGYSALLYTKQVFEYDYRYSLDGTSMVTVNEAHSMVRPKLNPGTLNVSLGLSSMLKNKKILETSVYYQNSLGRLGLEKSPAGFLGLKTVYWFPVR
jgi:hypothetical protein